MKPDPNPAGGGTHWRCRVTTDAAGIGLLRRLGADGRIGADHLAVRDGLAHLVLRERDIELLQGLGMAVERGSNASEPPPRGVQQPASRAPPAEGAEATSLLTGFVSAYLDTAGILARFDALHAAFPALTEWIDLPHPSHGYDGALAALHGPQTVKLLRITTTPASLAKPGLLLVAGMHAREWIPPLAAIEFAEQLLRTYTPGSAVPAVAAINALVEGLDILIVPAANPDGILFSHHDDAMWRKNRRDNPPPAACDGVDNNRNYGMYFGDAGSSGNPCSDSFRGPAAFSEPENRNVLNVIERFPNILTAIDCHSFGEDLFRAQPTGGLFIASQPVEPRDHAIFLGLEAAMNAAIGSVSPGKTYATGTTNNHAGTCDDYLFLAHRIFGFTLECGLDFQPPIATALGVVQEVSAALRALARETLNLGALFTTPVAIAHAIDRSGSMAAFGYAAPARQAAKRLVDLMSLGDSASISAFNQAAATPAPLAALANPGGYASARAAVDAIAFGGATSIGAGLQAAAATLTGTSGARAVLLLSDGYQNRAPWVADVLATLPAGLQVHTLALGPASDQPLLESIALATGGRYAFAPDALALHEMYDYMRAEAMDESLALNEDAAVPAGEAAHAWPVVVDEGASHATFCIAWSDAQVELRAQLVPPAGPVLDLSRMRRSDGSGYRVLRLRRPQRGTWTLRVERKAGGGPVRLHASAFIKSELHLRLAASPLLVVAGRPLSLRVQVRNGRQVATALQISASAGMPAASPGGLLQGWSGRLPKIPAALSRAKDALPRPIRQALAIRAKLMRDGAPDPLQHVVVPLAAPRDGPGFEDDGLDWSGAPAAEAAPAARVTHTDTRIAGSHNLRIRAEGRDPATGSPFVRLGLRSVVVRAP